MEGAWGLVSAELRCQPSDSQKSLSERKSKCQPWYHPQREFRNRKDIFPLLCKASSTKTYHHGHLNFPALLQVWRTHPVCPMCKDNRAGITHAFRAGDPERMSFPPPVPLWSEVFRDQTQKGPFPGPAPGEVTGWCERPPAASQAMGLHQEGEVMPPQALLQSCPQHVLGLRADDINPASHGDGGPHFDLFLVCSIPLSLDHLHFCHCTLNTLGCQETALRPSFLRCAPFAVALGRVPWRLYSAWSLHSAVGS